MKKIGLLVIGLMLMFSLAACGGDKPSEENTAQATAPTTQESTEEETANSDVSTDTQGQDLVVYFSWSGNTEAVANAIQEATGADIFEIVPAEPYTEDYDTLLDIAQNEQRSDARPAIADTIDNLDQYDTIYLGFPNWWGDMPMILYTFLDEYDLSGKTIAPFVTSGGSGFSGSQSTISEMEPNATLVNGLSLGSSEATNPDSDVAQWLEGLNLE